MQSEAAAEADEPGELCCARVVVVADRLFERRANADVPWAFRGPARCRPVWAVVV
jgi:hypothetical protein